MTESYLRPKTCQQAKKPRRFRCIRLTRTRPATTAKTQRSGKLESVRLDHWVEAGAQQPLVFKSLEKTTPYTPSIGEGGNPYPTPVFTFQYKITLFDDDQPWLFTKTGKSGGQTDWNTPLKPDPVRVKDDNSHPIMIAVVVILAAAVIGSV